MVLPGIELIQYIRRSFSDVLGKFAIDPVHSKASNYVPICNVRSDAALRTFGTLREPEKPCRGNKRYE